METGGVFEVTGEPRFKMRLGVIGHIPHWVGDDGEPRAYEPYVREMRVWAELFSEVVVCSPRAEGPPKGNLAPYLCGNIRWRPVEYNVQQGRRAIFRRCSQVPGVVRSAWETIRGSDFVLLRSPGHFGLLGACLVRVLGRRSLTKWAGENGHYENERLVPRLHRLFEAIPSRKHPVLVYGVARRSHHISFIPALMSNEELSLSRRLSEARRWSPPWNVLCVGRLVPEKGFALALRGLAELRRSAPGIPWAFTLIGDGPARGELEALTAELGLGTHVEFTGPLSFEDVQRRFATTHILIMPGVKEGWPKTIAEAWAHGAIPVAARGGIVESIIEDGVSGLIFEASPDELSSALVRLMTNPEMMREMSEKVLQLAKSLSLGQFKARLEQVLVERCGLS